MSWTLSLLLVNVLVGLGRSIHTEVGQRGTSPGERIRSRALLGAWSCTIVSVASCERVSVSSCHCCGCRVSWNRIQAFQALWQDEFYPAADPSQSIDIGGDPLAQQAPAESISEMITVLAD